MSDDALPPLDAAAELPAGVEVLTKRGRKRMTHLHPCDIDRTGRCNDAPLRISWLHGCSQCSRRACRMCYDATAKLCTACGGEPERGIH